MSISVRGWNVETVAPQRFIKDSVDLDGIQVHFQILTHKQLHVNQRQAAQARNASLTESRLVLSVCTYLVLAEQWRQGIDDGDRKDPGSGGACNRVSGMPILGAHGHEGRGSSWPSWE